MVGDSKSESKISLPFKSGRILIEGEMWDGLRYYVAVHKFRLDDMLNGVVFTESQEWPDIIMADSGPIRTVSPATEYGLEIDVRLLPEEGQGQVYLIKQMGSEDAWPIDRIDAATKMRADIEEALAVCRKVNEAEKNDYKIPPLLFTILEGALRA